MLSNVVSFIWLIEFLVPLTCPHSHPSGFAVDMCFGFKGRQKQGCGFLHWMLLWTRWMPVKATEGYFGNVYQASNQPLYDWHFLLWAP